VDRQWEATQDRRARRESGVVELRVEPTAADLALLREVGVLWDVPRLEWGDDCPPVRLETE
jgi:hypothetical protein